MRFKNTFDSLVIIIGWLLTFLLPLALFPVTTCTQGDDDFWGVSFFVFSPIVVIGFVLLNYKKSSLYKFKWLGLFHLISFILAIKLIKYWIFVTFSLNHICAGYSSDYIDSFEPETWHFLWAPIMTFLVYLAYKYNKIAWKK